MKSVGFELLLWVVPGRLAPMETGLTFWGQHAPDHCTSSPPVLVGNCGSRPSRSVNREATGCQAPELSSFVAEGAAHGDGNAAIPWQLRESISWRACRFRREICQAAATSERTILGPMWPKQRQAFSGSIPAPVPAAIRGLSDPTGVFRRSPREITDRRSIARKQLEISWADFFEVCNSSFQKSECPLWVSGISRQRPRFLEAASATFRLAEDHFLLAVSGMLAAAIPSDDHPVCQPAIRWNSASSWRSVTELPGRYDAAVLNVVRMSSDREDFHTCPAFANPSGK